MSRRLWVGFQDVVERLAAHGVPRPSDRWMQEVRRFYLHPTAKAWLACCGRGSGKNLVGILCDITELVHGDFKIAPGERHYQVQVGENTDEAQKTLRQQGAYFDMLGIPNERTKDTIDLGGELSDRGTKVLACRIGAVSGFRSTGDTHQEIAKWNNDGVNPADEIATSAAAQTVTHPSARHRYFSTPMGRTGFFYDRLRLGDTASQIVTCGPTWEFNPTITEAETRKLEPDERKWRREYLAEPQATALAAFDPTAVERAFAERPRLIPRRRSIIIDASSARKDRWSWGVCGWNLDAEGRGYLAFDLVDGLEGRFWEQVSAEELVDGIAHLAREVGITDVHGDQREAYALASLFERKGLRFTSHDWTATSKPRAVETVRRWLADGSLSLPPHEQLRRELLEFEEKLTASGGFRYEARRSGRDDYVALLLTAALADMGGELIAPVVEYDSRFDSYVPRLRV